MSAGEMNAKCCGHAKASHGPDGCEHGWSWPPDGYVEGCKCDMKWRTS